MKGNREKLAVFVVGAVAAMVLSANYSAYAQPPTSGFCTDGLIKGTYGFVVDGEILTPGGPLLLKGVAMTTFDGKGGLTQIDSTTANAMGGPGFSAPETGSYHVNDDCTGSFSIVFNDGTAVTTNFVVTTDGFEIDTVVVGTCTPPNTPPCTGQGADSVRSIGKKRFLRFEEDRGHGWGKE